MTEKDSYVIRQSEIEEIFTTMGDGYVVDFDIEIKPFEEFFGLRIPVFLQPRFWIAVATWFCEREHFGSVALPDWYPIDLAGDTQLAAPDHLYFDSFVFEDDTDVVTRPAS